MEEKDKKLHEFLIFIDFPTFAHPFRFASGLLTEVVWRIPKVIKTGTKGVEAFHPQIPVVRWRPSTSMGYQKCNIENSAQ